MITDFSFLGNYPFKPSPWHITDMRGSTTIGPTAHPAGRECSTLLLNQGIILTTILSRWCSWKQQLTEDSKSDVIAGSRKTTAATCHLRTRQRRGVSWDMSFLAYSSLRSLKQELGHDQRQLRYKFNIFSQKNAYTVQRRDFIQSIWFTPKQK